MPRTAVLLVLFALLGAIYASTAAAAPVLVPLPGGHVKTVQDPNLPPPDPIPPRPAAKSLSHLSARAAAVKATVGSELDRMLAEGSITQEAYDSALASWKAARATVKKVGGTRKSALTSIISMVNGLAKTGQLTPGRLPVVFEIVARNQEWFAEHDQPASGARVKFPDSRIVWQSYPGHGLQPQWLGTFGDANALAKSKKTSTNTQLGELLDQAIALASPRAGGIAWESFFSWSGAPPVWVSGLSQGTGIQALSRASVKLVRPDLLQAATSALGIFKTAPPEGVAQPADGGTHYLIYSTNPNLFVLNGFLQSLVGLYDYTQISQDPEGLVLFANGDRAAQAEVPRYDTGAWSLYEGTRESTLSYHQLVTGFLQNLCDRTSITVYCDTALHFESDETEAPELKIVTTKARTKKPVVVKFTLSKMSRVTLWVDDTPINAYTLGYGTRTITWPTGRNKPGEIDVKLTATDLAGNKGSTEGIIQIVRK